MGVLHRLRPRTSHRTHHTWPVGHTRRVSTETWLYPLHWVKTRLQGAKAQLSRASRASSASDSAPEGPWSSNGLLLPHCLTQLTIVVYYAAPQALTAGRLSAEASPSQSACSDAQDHSVMACLLPKAQHTCRCPPVPTLFSARLRSQPDRSHSQKHRKAGSSSKAGLLVCHSKQKEAQPSQAESAPQQPDADRQHSQAEASSATGTDAATSTPQVGSA